MSYKNCEKHHNFYRYKYMSARQILDFTVHFFFKRPQAAIDERVEGKLKLVGLDNKADRGLPGWEYSSSISCFT